MKFIPFRLKILGAFLALLASVLLATLYVVGRHQRRESHATIERQLAVTQQVFDQILAVRSRQLTTSLGLLASDFAFKQAVATRDAATIESAALNMRARIEADADWVTDDEGALYADTSRKFAAGASVAEMEVVAAALNEEAGSGIQVIGGVPYQVASTPILAPDLLGTLVAGFRIDDMLTAELKKTTQSEVSFVADGKIVASTLADNEREVLEASLADAAPGRSRIIGPKGSRFIVLHGTLPGGVHTFVQKSWEKALEPLEALQQLLSALGLLGFALTALAGFFIAGGVTRSMEILAKATEGLARGEFSVRVDIRTRDEIGLLGDAFNRMVTGLQEKEKMRSVLNKAVSKEIAEELLKRGEIKLGGEERRVTVLFSDIRGFTSISEALAPQELVGQLNEYFMRMGRAIERNQGVIDKYVGDAIMALFGAPVDSPQDADHALRAALAMKAALSELNVERASRSLPAWDMGIGLNTGQAVAGNMGSENRSSYTAIGDSVNLSSRLEGLTKHYGVAIIASASVLESASGVFEYRPLDLVRVKGKHEPVEIFEVFGEKGAAPEWRGDFIRGVLCYRGRKFDEAREAFSAVLARAPKDTPSELYLERIRGLASGVPDDWDPAHTMLEK